MPGIASGKLDPKLRESLSNGIRLQLDRAVVTLRRAGKPMTGQEVAERLGLGDGHVIGSLMERAFESHGIFHDLNKGTFRLVTDGEKAAGMNKYGVFLKSERVRLATCKGARVDAEIVSADGRWFAGYDYSCCNGFAGSGGPAKVSEPFETRDAALESVRSGAVAFFRSALHRASAAQKQEILGILGKLATPEQRAELETGKISKRKRNPHQRETGGAKRGGSGATQSGPYSRARREVAASAAPSTPPVECGKRLWMAYLTTFAARRNAIPIVQEETFDVSMQVDARRSASVAWICVVEAETQAAAGIEALRMWNAGEGELTAGGTQAGILQPSPEDRSAEKTERATSKRKREGDAGAPVLAKAKRASHVESPAVAAGGLVGSFTGCDEGPYHSIRFVVNPQPDGRAVISLPTKQRKSGAWDYVHLSLTPREVEMLRRQLLPFREQRKRERMPEQLELFGRDGRDGLGGAQI